MEKLNTNTQTGQANQSTQSVQQISQGSQQVPVNRHVPQDPGLPGGVEVIGTKSGTLFSEGELKRPTSPNPYATQAIKTNINQNPPIQNNQIPAQQFSSSPSPTYQTQPPMYQNQPAVYQGISPSMGQSVHMGVNFVPTIPRYVRNRSSWVLPIKVGEGDEAMIRNIEPGDYVDLLLLFGDMSRIMKSVDIREYLERGLLEPLTEEEYLKLMQYDRTLQQPVPSTNPMGIRAQIGDNYVVASPNVGESPVSPIVKTNVDRVKHYLSTGDRSGGLTPSQFATWLEHTPVSPNDVAYIKQELGGNPLIDSALKKVGGS